MEQNAAAYFKQALAKFRSRDVKGGLDDLEAAIRLDALRWEYYWTRGAFNYRRRVRKLAVSDFTKAIELCSDAKQAGKIYQRRMFSYGRLEQYDRLIQDATWLIEHSFGDEGVYLWRAWGKYKLGDMDGAIEDYSHVIESVSDSFFTRFNRAMVYYKSTRYTDALDDLNHLLNLRVVTLYPQTNDSLAYRVYQLRALIFYRLGDFEQSLADHNHCTGIIGFKTFTSVETYVDSMKQHIEVAFSGMPSRPHDKYVLKPPETQDK